jgi:gluconolactonase
MNLLVKNPRLYELISRNARMERLVSGFQFVEGPVWSEPQQELFFSDIPASIVYGWHPVRGLREIRNPSGKSNGLTLDHEDRLICCEHATFRVTRVEQDGSLTTLGSHYENKELNSPNDVIVKSDGSVYFTDPATRNSYWGTDKPRQLEFEGVYRIGSNGDLTLLADDFVRPNGLAFSPNEKVLYVDDTRQMHIRAFDVREDGTLNNNRIFFVEEGSGKLEDGVPDGLKTDEYGNVYCTGPGGIWIISREGEHLGTIETPERVANFAWGGPDGRTLFVAACTSIYYVTMRVDSSIWRRTVDKRKSRQG